MSTATLAELAAPIFSNIYRVRVRQGDLTPLEEISRHGSPSTGLKEWDRHLNEAPMFVYWTIARMVEYLEHDVPFSLVESGDAKRIVSIIDTYLDAILISTVMSLNIKLPPMEDVALLDALADILYPHALDETAVEIWQTKRPHGLLNPLSPNGLRQKQRERSFGQTKAVERKDYRTELAKLYARRGE